MKKFLSFTLALVMVLSLFAVSTFAATKTETVDVKWNFGYVGSSTNSSSANKINPNGSSYSYTDVIDMGPAGTTISFSDDMPAFASAAAYTISFWKKVGDSYELDLEAANAPGGNEKGEVTYSFTTTEDNQGVRISYRSEHTASLTPEFEDVYVNGVKVTTTWKMGYVQPAGTIKDGGSAYSYTDVIVVEKAGSTVTFTDTNKNGTAFASSGAAVFTTWKKDGDNWVFGGTAVNGTDALATAKGNVVTYTYTSTKDNELVRLCYRSEESATAPIDASKRPVVTLTREVADDTPVQPPGPTGDAAIIFAAIALVSLAGVMVAKKRAER